VSVLANSMPPQFGHCSKQVHKSLSYTHFSVTAFSATGQRSTLSYATEPKTIGQTHTHTYTQYFTHSHFMLSGLKCQVPDYAHRYAVNGRGKTGQVCFDGTSDPAVFHHSCLASGRIGTGHPRVCHKTSNVNIAGSGKYVNIFPRGFWQKHRFLYFFLVGRGQVTGMGYRDLWVGSRIGD
jgi:hypothetical protein